MLNRIQQKISIPPELSGKRLDQALAELLPNHSRSRLQSWIKTGEVLVNSHAARQRLIVNCGDEVSIDATEDVHDEWEAEDIPLDILFEDNAIIILNKPPGLVVHPGAGNKRHTLLNALLSHEPELRKVPRAGIVHRLDKDTSGIMIVARTPEAHTILVANLQKREINREYQCIVNGIVTAGGTIDKPVGRHPKYRTKMAVCEQGREAITHYRVIKKYRHFTHLLVSLESGRTHQIRVHMAYIRHPILGDPLYSGRKRIPAKLDKNILDTIIQFPRQALHASRLIFKHPITGKNSRFDAPLPEDMIQLLKVLAEDAA